MRRLLPLITLAGLLALFGLGCASQPATERTPIEPDALPKALAAISPEVLEEQIAYMSRDEMLGRGTGSAEKARTAEWIAEKLEAAGAVPAGVEGFMQQVPMVGYRKVPGTSTLELRGPEGVLEDQPEVDFTWWPANLSEQVSLDEIPLVFVGHGITAPEVGWDDIKGAELAGKVLVFLNDDPRVREAGEELFNGEARTYYGRWTYKFEQAKALGALGAIVIHTTESAGYGWQVIGDKGARNHFALDAPGAGYDLPLLAWMHEDLAQRLAATVDSSLEEWFEMAKSRDFEPFELPVTISASTSVELKKKRSPNVLGLIEGSDPALRDEIVVVTAHYDHLGKLSPESGREDLIYNGAWDNASGTASILGMAQGLAVAEIKPRRSVLIFAVAAHEMGLLGSRWFAEHPTVDLARVVANINVDMPQIFGATRDIVAIGKEQSELGELLASVAGRFELPDGGTLRVEGDPTPGAGRYYRSDQLHFARKGVPAIYVGPGTDYIEEPRVDTVEYRAEHYHQVSDELNEAWCFDGLARDARVVMLALLEIANRDERPQWSETSEFRQAG